MSITHKSQRRIDQPLGIPTTRPALTIASFFAPFAITLFMFWLDSDHLLVVLPCVSFAFASTLLCIQLLGGNIVPFKWLLIVAIVCAAFSGRQWYGFALLTIGTGLSMMAMDRYVGLFAPLLDSSSKCHRVFPIGRLARAADGGRVEAA